MAQQNEKQPKAKTGLARCLELASGHKGLVFLAGFLAALAAICSFVPYLSIYYIIREILFVYPDMAKLGRNEDVRVNVLEKLCTSLDCKLDDIVEFETEQKK